MINGADVVDILNLPPYGCARRLYFQKTEEKALDPCYYASEQNIKKRANICGDVIVGAYCKKTGRRVRGANRVFHDPRYPFILGDCDRIQTNSSSKNGIGSYVPLEIRVISLVDFYRLRRDGLPAIYYTWQLHHLMIAKQASWSSIVFFCLEIMELLNFDITYDEATAAEVIKTEKTFIGENFLQKRKPPVFTEKKCCRLCGYRTACFAEAVEYHKDTKEEYELLEQTLRVEEYLNEK
jgi:predicted phage-related endonuclease